MTVIPQPANGGISAFWAFDVGDIRAGDRSLYVAVRAGGIAY